MNKVALICGISGQDGSYLAKFLLSKNYIVVGTSRKINNNKFINHKLLQINKQIKIYKLECKIKKDVRRLINKIQPDEIYYLSSVSSVKDTLLNPNESFNSSVVGLLNFIESIKKNKKLIKFFNACSSECYGNIEDKPVTEVSSFNPQSPYALAKVCSYMLVKNYRINYNLHLTNGILFNHESSLRTNKFLSKRIISNVIKINKNRNLKMTLSNLDKLKRDWGWAPEYVEAIHSINNFHIPGDYIVATGKSSTLRQFVKIAFNHFDMDYKKFVNEKIYKTKTINSKANPSKIFKELNWKSKLNLKDIIKKMIDNEL